ncbi:hypothetical protein CAOG_03064 [Capsaspora owczarzaki ATCC 30864]|uniref:Uncharacterized protein n=1 Tax=Capsaspora owczarzaki (strain ATCC 30864) TaxID=595528 RepID=A0A0D2X267_CAPO3|nr:hypothetical protein CAOG_03064 [Capsaspora owczarzaki ATCC 30864]KJE92029.1 hypothetical protein CAOG_003064 [Capsaspora owczarzaki ATCC 30864]|eukprot:XP_004363903.2 hypothetical protein CAOG_03064 [Capsaspora owczarzaki ATCC 30864]
MSPPHLTTAAVRAGSATPGSMDAHPNLMATVVFDQLEAGLADNGEETSRFGARKEEGIALYRVDTMATAASAPGSLASLTAQQQGAPLSSRNEADEEEEQHKENGDASQVRVLGAQNPVSKSTKPASTASSGAPAFFASASPHGMCLCVNKQIHIFGSNCDQLLATVNLDASADAVVWSDDGVFLVIADSLGSVHFLHVPSQLMLFSQQLVAPGALQGGSTPSAKQSSSVSSRARPTAFAAMQFIKSLRNDAVYELIVASAQGQLFRFFDIDLSALAQAIVQRNLAQAKQIQAAITMSCTDLRTVHPKAVSSMAACVSVVPVTSGTGPSTADSADTSATSGGAVLRMDPSSAVVVAVTDSEKAAVSLWVANYGEKQFRQVDLCARVLGGVPVSKIQAMPDGKHFLTCNDAGKLALWRLQREYGAVSCSFSLQLLRESAVGLACSDFSVLPFCEEDDVLATLGMIPSESHEYSQSTNTGKVPMSATAASTVAAAAKSVSCSQGKIAAVTLASETGALHVEIMALPSFARLYTLEVPNKTCIATMEFGYDSVAFVEYRSGEENSSKLIVRRLQETLPTNRFYHLLHKGHFEEAIQFAKLFQMDVELVHKVRCTHIADVAIKGGVGSAAAEGADKQLVDALRNVKDLDYVIEFCIQASLPSLQSTVALLEFAQASLLADDKSAQQRLSVGDRELRKMEVADTLHRLSTFHLSRCGTIAGGTAASPVALPFDGIQWQQFRVADPAKEVVAQLNKGNLGAATVVWRRHVQDLDGSLKAHIRHILAAIPEGFEVCHQLGNGVSSSMEDGNAGSTIVSSSHYCAWLSAELIPHIASHRDIAFFASWLEQRSRLLEKAEPAKWPANGIAMLSLAKPLTVAYAVESGSAAAAKASEGFAATPLDTIRRMVLFAPLPTSSQPDGLSAPTAAAAAAAAASDDGEDDLERKSSILAASQHFTACLTAVQTLHRQLETLAYLRELDIKMTLDHFVQETPSSICLFLLERVAAAELLAGVVQNEIQPFAQRESLKCDDVLQSYCNELMAGCTAFASALSDSPWEARVVAIIPCIQGISTRVDVTLEMMRHIVVPWSTSVETIVQNALTVWSHDRQSEVGEQYRIMHIRKALSLYGFRAFNMSDMTQARGLVSAILSRLDVPSALDDALSVVKAYHHLEEADAYVIRLQNLCPGWLPTDGATIEPSRLEQACVERSTAAARAIGSLTSSKTLCSVASHFLQWLHDTLDDNILLQEYDKRARLAVMAYSQRVLEALLLQSQDLVLQSAVASACSGPQAAEQEVVDSRLVALRKQLSMAIKRLPVCRELQTGFGEIAGLSDWQTDAQQQDIVARLFAAEMSDASLERLTRLLGMDHRGALLCLARLALDSGNIDRSLCFCEAALAFGDALHPESHDAVITFVQSLVAKVANDFAEYEPNLKLMKCKVVPRCLRLIQQCAAVCNIPQLGDAVGAYKYIDLASAVLENCECDPSSSPSTDRGDSAASYALIHGGASSATSASATRFVETGLVLSSRSAMPVAARLVAQASSGPATCAPLATITKSARELVQLAKDNSLYSLALRYSLHSLATCVLKMSHNAELPLDAFLLPEDANLAADANDDEPGLRQALEKSNETIQTMLSAVATQSCSVIDTLASLLTGKIVQAPAVDGSLAIGALFSMRLDHALDALHAHISIQDGGHARLSSLARVGSILLAQDQSSDSVLQTEFQQLDTQAQWWNYLAVQGIDFNPKRFLALGQAHEQAKADGLLAQPSEFQTYVAALCQKLVASWCAGLRTPAEASAAVRSVHFENIVRFAACFGVDSKVPLLSACRSLLLDSTTPLAILRIVLPPLLAHTNDLEGIFECLLDECLGELDATDYPRIRFVLATCQQVAGVRRASVPLSVQQGSLVIDVLEHFDRFMADQKTQTTARQVKSATARVEGEAPARMSFHALICPQTAWEVLAPFLTIESLPRLLPLSRILQLPSDKFYVAAIQSMLVPSTSQASSHLANAEQTAPESKATAASLIEMIDRIADMDFAVATAASVAERLPLGDDKLALLRHAVQLVEKWGAQLAASGGSAATVDRVKKVSETLSHLSKRTATHVELHRAQLDLPELLEHLDTPAELVCQLYWKVAERNSAPAAKGAAPQSEGKHDIHALVNGIASRYMLSADKIRRYLLETWIAQVEKPTVVQGWRVEDAIASSSSSVAQPSASTASRPGARSGGMSLMKSLLLSDSDVKPAATAPLQAPPTKSAEHETDAYAPVISPVDEASLNRAILVARADVTKSLATLLPMVMQGLLPSSSKTSQPAQAPASQQQQQQQRLASYVRYRAARVTLAVAPILTIEKAFASPIAEFQTLVQQLLIHTELERVGVSQSLAELESCNMEGMIRALWRNHSGKPAAVRLIANLCLDYEIFDPSLWSGILPQLAKFGMMTFLAATLTRLSGVSESAQIPCLQSVWQNVLLSKSIAPQEATSLFDCFPSLFDLRLEDLFARAMQDANTPVALRCAVAATGVTRSKMIKDLLEAKLYIEVLDGIDRMAASPALKNVVYEWVDARQDYGTILHSTHFPEFVLHMITNDRIDSLLRATMSANRSNEAVALVERYLKLRPFSRFASHLADVTPIPSGMALVEAYLNRA